MGMTAPAMLKTAGMLVAVALPGAMTASMVPFESIPSAILLLVGLRDWIGVCFLTSRETRMLKMVMMRQRLKERKVLRWY
jgi:hypothetical protein